MENIWPTLPFADRPLNAYGIYRLGKFLFRYEASPKIRKANLCLFGSGFAVEKSWTGPAFTYNTYSLDLSEFKFKFLSGMILFLCLLCCSIVRTALRCPCHAMQWVNEYVLVSICTPDFGFVHRKSQRYERNLTDWTITNNKPATVLHLTMHRTFMRFASEQTKMYAKRMFIPQNNSNRNRNSSDRLSGLFIWILSASASASSSLVYV